VFRLVFVSIVRGVVVGPALVFALTWGSAFAAEGGLELPGAESFKEIEIVGGERLILADGKMKSLEEDVELILIPTLEKDENLKIKADRIDFSYDEKAETATFSRVVAKGNVSLTMETSKDQLLADELTWSVAENKAELRGNPRAVTEKYTLTGELIVYYITEGRGVVTKPRGTFVMPEKKKDTEEEMKKEEEAKQ
jgi:hypothetical protein